MPAFSSIFFTAIYNILREREREREKERERQNERQREEEKREREVILQLTIRAVHIPIQIHI
jgi:hypothetical protein